MEQSLDYLRDKFALEGAEPAAYSPLALAYIGDAAYELVIRSILVLEANRPVNDYHRQASRLVRASAQARMMETIGPMLTEEETRIYRRGRNAHPATVAKHASVGEYHRATGFEAVMGYLYLREDWGRMIDLIRAGIENGVEE